MRIIRLISKPLDEIVFFIVCLFCIIPPSINHLLILFDEMMIVKLIIKYLSIAITISYFITCIVYLSRKHSLVKFLIYTSVISLLFIYLFLKLTFGTNISPLIITMIAETNVHESLEFLNNFAFTKRAFILYFAFTAAFYFVIKAEQHIKKRNFLKKLITPVVIVTFPISVYSLHIAKELYECNNMNEVNNWYDKYYPYAMDNISSFAYSMYIPHITSKEIETAITNTNRAIQAKAESRENDSLDVIFVIGESFIKYHAHIYDYQLPTTPRLDEEKKRGNLFVFSDMISPYNATTLAVKNILCTNSLADGESWSEGIYFPSIFKKAGFNVYMWDNQKYLGTFLIYTFTINSFLYNKTLSKLTYTDCNNTTYQYDEELIKSFFKINTGKRNFVILHLMGQHVDASERYPDRFNKFTAADIQRNESYINNQKKQSIAEYDNATLYNDYVLGEVFNHYKDKNAVVVYISDHGEEIYDIRDSKGRNLDMAKKKNIIKYQNDVPFMIWCSDKYISLHPTTVKNISESLDKKGMTDNICHTLFELANISTPYYKPERAIINSDYQSSRRIIYDKFDYDALN